MKRMFFVCLVCMILLATLIFAVSVEARSLKNKGMERSMLSSNYNFAKDKSLARVEVGKTYREKLKVKRLENIEKSNQQYSQKREAKVAQNKALRMQKIVLSNLAPSRISRLAAKK